MCADHILDADILEARHDKVRNFLQEQDLGALFVYSPPMAHSWAQTGHVSYLSGWANRDRIVDSAVVVPAKGPAALMFAGMPFMIEQVAQSSPMQNVRLVQAVDPNAVAVAREEGATAGPKPFAMEALAMLEENGLGGKDVGVAGLDTMPVPFYDALSAGLGGKLRRVDDIVARIRSVKTPAEVEKMRKAAHLSDLGFETMQQVARPGMKGIEIVAEMERAVRRQGADYVAYWMASAPPTDWKDSRLDLKPHERVLGEGDLMASCSYVVYQGYWCHGQRTGSLSKPSERLQQQCKIAREAQDAGLALLKPGVPIGQVAQEIRIAAGEGGFPLEGGRIGHGIGMDYSEQPVPLSESNSEPLKAGMTAVIHVTYSLPGSGKMFVPLGDVCHVTENGAELLMEFPRTPFVAGQ